MELQILADQFIIHYSSLWMSVLLLSGLVLFFISKWWRKRLMDRNIHSFKPGVLFTVSFIFLMGGIHLFVYKIVLNKDMIILFNIKDFNRQLEWVNIDKVAYQDKQQIIIYMKNTEPGEQPVKIDLLELDQSSMEKVKILIDYKLKQSRLAN